MPTIQETAYGYETRTIMPFAEAVAKTKATFLAEGFGVLSEIDVQEKLREKLHKTMDAYLILGMCNPKLAATAIDIEPNIGLLLPCNVVVRETNGQTLIAAQKPSLLADIVATPAIAPIAQEAEEKILKALKAIGGGEV